MMVPRILTILSSSSIVIKRWDNAPHWKEIKTFPFHVHLAGHEKPRKCAEVFVQDVLVELRGLLGGDE